MDLYTNKVNCITKHKIKKLFQLALDEVKCQEEIGVSVSFVDENKIRELNREHRQVDKVTDVLSFPMLDIKAKQNVSDFKEDLFNEIYLGDIVICTKRAKEQAKEYGHSYNRELCFLALHGLLHVLGYDHMNPDEEKEMMELAEKILLKANIRREK